jgi:hypothetical protein
LGWGIVDTRQLCESSTCTGFNNVTISNYNNIFRFINCLKKFSGNGVSDKSMNIPGTRFSRSNIFKLTIKKSTCGSSCSRSLSGSIPTTKIVYSLASIEDDLGLFGSFFIPIVPHYYFAYEIVSLSNRIFSFPEKIFFAFIFFIRITKNADTIILFDRHKPRASWDAGILRSSASQFYHIHHCFFPKHSLLIFLFSCFHFNFICFKAAASFMPFFNIFISAVSAVSTPGLPFLVPKRLFYDFSCFFFSFSKYFTFSRSLKCLSCVQRIQLYFLDVP